MSEIAITDIRCTHGAYGHSLTHSNNPEEFAEFWGDPVFWCSRVLREIPVGWVYAETQDCCGGWFNPTEFKAMFSVLQAHDSEAPLMNCRHCRCPIYPLHDEQWEHDCYHTLSEHDHFAEPDKRINTQGEN
jgi:hypothetical protein